MTMFNRDMLMLVAVLDTFPFMIQVVMGMMSIRMLMNMDVYCRLMNMFVAVTFSK